MTDAAFAQAAYIVKLETTINRVTGVPMELRSALGAHPSRDGSSPQPVSSRVPSCVS